MAQFDVYRNPDEESQNEIPFLLDVQHELHFQLRTRLVVPLVGSDSQKSVIHALCPAFVIEGRSVFASVPEMSSFPAKGLEEKVGSLADRRSEVFAAIDLLLNGF